MKFAEEAMLGVLDTQSKKVQNLWGLVKRCKNFLVRGGMY